MARNNQRTRKNNNPEGRNQHSGWSGTARDNPMKTAAAAAAAVGAGVFLWSRRNQISDQLSSLGEQIGEWTETMRSGSEDELELAGGNDSFASGTTTGSTSRKSGSRSSSNLSGNETA